MSQPARWYRLEGEEQIGPLQLDDMRELVLADELGPDDYVWADGMDQWLPAGEVPALVPPPHLRGALDPRWETVAG